MDITRNARWTSDCCGKQDFDFEIIHADTRYWPDLTALCTFFLCPGKYYPKDGGFIEEYDAVKLVESDYIRGDSEEEVKLNVRKWYNEHIIEALEKAITIISGPN